MSIFARRRARPRRAPLAVIGLLGLLALGAGCSDRPRTNPLDPRNPVTGGGPTAFAARAGNASVALSWDAAPAGATLGGFLLERRVHGDPSYAPLGPALPTTATGYVDNAVTNDTDYDYRLSYLLPAGGTTGAQVERSARPGPEVVWVADPGLDEVIRLTPDGRARVFTLGGIEACNRVSVQLSGGQIWATSPLTGVVRVFDVNGAPLSAFNGPSEPNAIAVDPTSLTAWICEEVPSAATVRRWRSDGALLAQGPAFGLPTDVAITPGGGAWIVDQQAGRLVRLDASGAPADTVNLPPDPRRIARNPLDGSLWVTCYSTGAVVHVSAAGDILATYTGFAGPYGVDVDEFRDQVWIGLDAGDAVVAISPATGAVLHRADGIPRPRSLTVDDRTGECFVAAIESHELVRLDSTGTVLWRNPDFSAPFDVKVDPGPR